MDHDSSLDFKMAWYSFVRQIFTRFGRWIWASWCAGGFGLDSRGVISIFIVANRLSVNVNADVSAVVEKGWVTEQWSHNELSARSVAYQQPVKAHCCQREWKCLGNGNREELLSKEERTGRKHRLQRNWFQSMSEIVKLIRWATQVRKVRREAHARCKPASADDY